MAGFRSGVAALVLFALIPQARGGWTVRTWITGVFYAATLILFVTANKLTTSANAIFLQSTAPLYLCLLGPLVLKEAIRKVDLAVMGGVLGGVFLLMSGVTATVVTAPHPGRGNLLALASGLTWALTITGLRMAARDGQTGDPGMAAVVVGNLLAFLFCLPFAVPVLSISAADSGAVLYLGAIQIGVAYFLMNRSLRSVPALEASVLLLAEPALNPLWAWILTSERPGWNSLAGGCVIALAAVAGSWWRAGFTTNSQLQYKI